MAKTTSAEKPEPEEISDGLEIISIGSLHNGPWDKKYWSSSRGKDRYPYPVGYQATRAYNGTTYKMEIHEGVSGPRFVITSADGYSCSGKTPDIAWEEFQRICYPRMKIWHGKRLSSKMDGLELFGFKNPLVQRLLRELVADLNGIAERSLNSCSEISRVEHDDCHQNKGTYPDLLPCLGRSQVTGKRGRRCESKNVKLHGETFHKRPRPQVFTSSSIASITHNVSEEENEDQNTGVSASMHVISSTGGNTNCFSLKNGFPLNRIDISDDQEEKTVHAKMTSGFVDSTSGKATETTDSFSKEEPLHRSQEAELNTSNLLVAREDKKLLALVSKDSEGCEIDLCAPDTIDYGQGNTSDSTPSTLDKNAYSEKAHQIASGEVLSIKHHPSFEKSVFDSGCQDVAKSMMSVLLPQVIPLLNDLTTEKLTMSPSRKQPSIMKSNEEDNKLGNHLEAASSVVTENVCLVREGKVHMPNTDLSSVIPMSEHAKLVIPDSFEPSQCENHKSNQAILHSGIAEASRASFDKEACSPTSQEQQAIGVLPNESSKCHADIKLTKNKFCHSSELDSEDLPQDLDICIPDSVLEHTPTSLDRVISERSNDGCTDMEENSNQVRLNSMGMDPQAPHDFDICIHDSVLEHMPPLERVISKCSNDACTDMEENSNQVGMNSMKNDHEAAHDYDICIPHSVIEHMPPLDRVISKSSNAACTDMEENSNQVGLNSMEEEAAHDFDICIPDSVIEHMPPLDGVISKSRNDACTDKEENSSQVGLNSMEMDHNAAHYFDICIPDSVLEHTPPLDVVISKSSNDACKDMEDNSNQVGLNSTENEHEDAHDFTGDISNSPEKNTEDEVVRKTGNVETMILPSVQVPNIVYTRKKFRNVTPLTGNCLLRVNARTDKYGELVTSEMNAAKGTSPPSENILLHASDSELCEPVLLGNQARDEVQPDDLQRNNSITSSQIKHSLTESDNGPFLCATKEKTFCPDGLSVSCIETPPIRTDVLSGLSNLAESKNPISCWDPNPSSSENNCSSKEAQVVSELNPDRNKDISDNLGKIIKFVGCYFLPMPVSSLFLSRRENDILIYVICGPVVDQERTLFTYKVSVKEPNVGCPSFIAFTLLRLPDPKHNFVRETLVERSGVQLTPDGHYIVLLGSIKTPNCRERKICCYCSSCTSVCSEENALKIVQVEHGYVSVVATLRTVEAVHCILVCEPDQLCFVGESGRLHVWVMNSTWRDKVEDFVVPADDTISPGIVELKRIPKCDHFIVGCNSVGEFSLWDISKRNCVSSFSASTNPFNQFLPVGLFNCQTNSLGFTYTSLEEQVDQFLGATRLWFSEHKETCSFLPSEEGDIAMWLLISTAYDVESPDNCISSHCQINTARSWRLALLVKNNMILGTPFNIRTTAIGVLRSHGLISTRDGLVYIWDLYGGSMLGTLHHFQDGTVTCIATDDSRGGALGVAGGNGQLLVYAAHNEHDVE